MLLSLQLAMRRPLMTRRVVVMAATTAGARPLSSPAAATATTAPPPRMPSSSSRDRTSESVEALKKIILKNYNNTHSNVVGEKTPFLVTEEVLQRAVKDFTSQLENARLCILDVSESQTLEEYEQDYQTAVQAIQGTVQSYVDWIELLGQYKYNDTASSESRAEWEQRRVSLFEELQVQLKAIKQCVRQEVGAVPEE